MDKKVFEQFKIISVQVLDTERNDHKMLAIENKLYEGGGYEYMFLFFEEAKTLYYIAELERIGAVDFYKNVTEYLIDGRLEQNEDFRNIYFGFPKQSSESNDKSDFTHLFDFFLLKNRTIDHVMDRINKLGMDNILDIDKEILKRS